MLTLTPSPAAFIRIRATGRLTAADYRDFEPAFVAELARRTSDRMLACRPDRLRIAISLLLDMRGFRGWTSAAFLRDLAWDLRNRRTFSKIAVIGDRPWHRWITATGAPLFRAPMKFFGGEREAAAWLSSSR
jgi:SpoIIAA-like